MTAGAALLAYASVTGDWALAGQAGLALLADGINRLDPDPSGNPDPSFSYSWEFGGSSSYASGGSSGTSNGESASTTGIQITYGDDGSISGNFDYDYYEQVTISLSVQEGIGAVPGYDETGSNSWRASNDQAFIDAVDTYNAKHGLSPGDAGYWTPQRLKAQAMIESGGHKAAFLSDPLQVNVSGDWGPKKASLLGLTKGQTMTLSISSAVAIEWMNYKGHIHNSSGVRVSYRAVFQVLRRYNGNTRFYPKHPSVQHRDWYASQVLSLESQM